MKKKDPQFVTRGVFHFFWMNPNNTRSPPPEVGRLRGRALAKLNHAERTMLLNLNLETVSSVLAPCGTHTTHISCTDDSKDFCEGSTAYVGLLILFAIFLPGIVRALGNLMFYNVSICSTRPKPAYGRQGLDWIVGSGYSFVVFSTNQTMETNQ